MMRFVEASNSNQVEKTVSGDEIYGAWYIKKEPRRREWGNFGNQTKDSYSIIRHVFQMFVKIILVAF